MPSVPPVPDILPGTVLGTSSGIREQQSVPVKQEEVITVEDDDSVIELRDLTAGDEFQTQSSASRQEQQSVPVKQEEVITVEDDDSVIELRDLTAGDEFQTQSSASRSDQFASSSDANGFNILREHCQQHCHPSRNELSVSTSSNPVGSNAAGNTGTRGVFEKLVHSFNIIHNLSTRNRQQENSQMDHFLEVQEELVLDPNGETVPNNSLEVQEELVLDPNGETVPNNSNVEDDNEVVLQELDASSDLSPTIPDPGESAEPVVEVPDSDSDDDVIAVNSEEASSRIVEDTPPSSPEWQRSTSTPQGMSDIPSTSDLEEDAVAREQSMEDDILSSILSFQSGNQQHWMRELQRQRQQRWRCSVQARLQRRRQELRQLQRRLRYQELLRNRRQNQQGHEVQQHRTQEQQEHDIEQHRTQEQQEHDIEQHRTQEQQEHDIEQRRTQEQQEHDIEQRRTQEQQEHDIEQRRRQALQQWLLRCERRNVSNCVIYHGPVCTRQATFSMRDYLNSINNQDPNATRPNFPSTVRLTVKPISELLRPNAAHQVLNDSNDARQASPASTSHHTTSTVTNFSNSSDFQDRDVTHPNPLSPPPHNITVKPSELLRLNAAHQVLNGSNDARQASSASTSHHTTSTVTNFSNSSDFQDRDVTHPNPLSPPPHNITVKPLSELLRPNAAHQVLNGYNDVRQASPASTSHHTTSTVTNFSNSSDFQDCDVTHPNPSSSPPHNITVRNLSEYHYLSARNFSGTIDFEDSEDSDDSDVTHPPSRPSPEAIVTNFSNPSNFQDSDVTHPNPPSSPSRHIAARNHSETINFEDSDITHPASQPSPVRDTIGRNISNCISIEDSDVTHPSPSSSPPHHIPARNLMETIDIEDPDVTHPASLPSVPLPFPEADAIVNHVPTSRIEILNVPSLAPLELMNIPIPNSLELINSRQQNDHNQRSFEILNGLRISALNMMNLAGRFSSDTPSEMAFMDACQRASQDIINATELISSQIQRRQQHSFQVSQPTSQQTASNFQNPLQNTSQHIVNRSQQALNFAYSPPHSSPIILNTPRQASSVLPIGPQQTSSNLQNGQHLIVNINHIMRIPPPPREGEDEYLSTFRAQRDVIIHLLLEELEKVLMNTPEVCITQDQVDYHLKCPVCQDDFRLGEMAMKLVCSHLFHRNCIVTWLKNNFTCPSCRKNVLEGKILELSEDGIIATVVDSNEHYEEEL